MNPYFDAILEPRFCDQNDPQTRSREPVTAGSTISISGLRGLRFATTWGTSGKAVGSAREAPWRDGVAAMRCVCRA